MTNKELDAYMIEEATHVLKCRYCIRLNCYEYEMLCRVLGKIKSGKVKIVVFGPRYWKNKEPIKKISYVWPHRIRKREERE